MNKSELIEFIAQDAEIPKTTAARALDGVIRGITEALKQGDTVTLIGFGAFYVSERGERTGRNFKTNEQITIKASKSPRFRAGKTLKDAL